LIFIKKKKQDSFNVSEDGNSQFKCWKRLPKREAWK